MRPASQKQTYNTQRAPAMKRSLLALSIGLATSGSANALMVTVQDNISDNLYVNSGSLSGQFNVQTALSTQYFAPYQISSATFKFSFNDDSYDSIYSGSNSTYQGSYQSGYSHYNVYNSTTFYNDPSESATLGIAGAPSQTAQSNYYNTGSNYTGTNTSYNGSNPVYYSYSYSCGWWSTCYGSYLDHYDYFYTQTNNYTQTSGYNGAFSINGALNGTALDNLKNSGILNFNLGLSGDLVFNKAELFLDISPNPISNVPEPGALILFGLGIAGLGASRRLKRR